MKVLLMNPPYTHGTRWIPVSPPLGIGQISSFLKQHGHTVRLIDAFDWSDNQVAQAISEFKPDFIGVTGNSMIRHQQFHVCELAKILHPSAMVVAGGTHVTAMAEQVLTCYPAVDVAVRNEGEATMLELVEGRSLGHIDGISYVEDGQVVHRLPRRPFPDLDDLPFIDWDSFNLQSYHREVDCDPLIERGLKSCMICSRGCVHRCTWCYVMDMFGRRWRTMSVKRILAEARYLVEVRGSNYIRFYDDEFCVNRRRVVELCETILSEGPRFYWRMQTRVDSLDPELCALIKRAGCVTVELGIESGSQKILDRAHKDTTVEQNREAIRMVKAAGLLAKAFLIVGNPGENPETLAETERFMRDTRPDWGSVCTGTRVLPKTEVWYELQQQGLIKDEVFLMPIEVPFYPVDVPQQVLDYYTSLFEGCQYRDRDPRSVV